MHAIYGSIVVNHKSPPPPFVPSPTPIERHNIVKIIVLIEHFGALAV